MKTFVVLVCVAFLAVFFLEITQSNAQGEERRRCRQKPELNTTKVECDRLQWPIGRAIACKLICLECYSREELASNPGCLVKGRCVCLAKPEQGTTTENPGETTTTEAGTTTEAESSSTTETTSEDPISTTENASEEPSTTAESVSSSTETASEEPTTTQAAITEPTSTETTPGE